MSIIDKPIVKTLMLKGEKGEKGDTGDVSLSQLNEEKNARENADINLQSQISSLGSGSPLVASSTSEMTDTTRVYVNTTDGNWYYYDGNSWEIGGVYQASVDPDQTEINTKNIKDIIINDRLKKYNVKNLTFNIIEMNLSTGILVQTDPTQNALYSAVEIVKKGNMIKLPSSYTKYLLKYHKDTNEADPYHLVYDGYTTLNDNYYTFEEDTIFRIGLIQENDFTVDECSNLTDNGIVKLYSVDDYYIVDNIKFEPGHIEGSIPGGIYTSVRLGYDYDRYGYGIIKEGWTRYRSYEFIKLISGTKIEITNGYRLYLFNKSTQTGSWKTGTFVIDSTSLYRLCLDVVSTTKIYYYNWSNLNEVINIIYPNESVELFNENKNTSLTAVSGYNTYVSGGYQNPVASKKNLTFAVISDLHGSENAFKRFKDYVNMNKKYIDYAICLGDTVLRSPADSISWFDDVVAEFNVPFLYVVGNHDTADTSLAGITEAQAKTKYFSTILTKEWLTSSNFLDTNRCSWYKDNLTYKIRIISLFEYQNSEEIASGAPASYCRRWLDTDTLQWFANKLYDTPENYSVIVLLHQFPYYPLSFVENDFTISSDMRNTSTLSNTFLNTVNGDPIEEIINAFINSTSISKTYESIASYSLGKTATVSKDFSNRSENGKFLGYISGHQHGSYITHSNTYTNQFNVSTPSGSESTFQRSYGDTNFDDNRNQDNFYIIGLNTVKNKINIVQIGNQTTNDMRTRDKISINI